VVNRLPLVKERTMKRTTCTGQTSLALEWRRPTMPELPDEPKKRAELIALMGDAIVKVFKARAARRKTGETDEHSGTA